MENDKGGIFQKDKIWNIIKKYIYLVIILFITLTVLLIVVLILNVVLFINIKDLVLKSNNVL